VTLFSSLSPLLPFISHLHRTPSPPFFSLHTSHKHQPITISPAYSATGPFPLHRATFTPPPHTAADSISPPFPFFLTQTQFLQILILSPIFIVQRHKSIQDCVLLLLCWVSFTFAGVGLGFKVGFQTLDFRNAHQVFDKLPQPVPECLEAKLHLLDPTEPKP
jgi:hypothetical protein